MLNKFISKRLQVRTALHDVSRNSTVSSTQAVEMSLSFRFLAIHTAAVFNFTATILLYFEKLIQFDSFHQNRHNARGCWKNCRGCGYWNKKWFEKWRPTGMHVAGACRSQHERLIADYLLKFIKNINFYINCIFVRNN